MVKTAFNFSFYGHWSLHSEYHLRRKTAEKINTQTLFWDEFPFRWHFRNEDYFGMIAFDRIFRSKNRLNQMTQCDEE